MSSLVDNSLESICTINQDITQIGFSSEELENGADNDEEIKTSINRMALEKLKNDLEGKCIGAGYVIPGSVKMLERSNITFPHESLQLYYCMKVKYEYKLCNPNPGIILKCKVITKNKIGLLGRLNSDKSPLVILVPEDLCDSPEKRELVRNSEIGSILSVLVVGKKFEQNDKKITVIAEVNI
jgi:DNA-directed RNA polymerase subunit E'/Rpb7|uniref:S1 motif domain-containing protein n=1 Tax=viral metagenome TaxID=1070528 RepID=A0A6C0AGC2_9ZZZZ|tara:strand:+ start:612 stop:1160 length:549 start_codon:yes stop_codon:yes gene_type:complete